MVVTVPPDPDAPDAETAARWYRAAADRRLDLARLALARLQRTGALEPDPDEGQIKLLETAARRGPVVWAGPAGTRPAGTA